MLNWIFGQTFFGYLILIMNVGERMNMMSAVRETIFLVIENNGAETVFNIESFFSYLTGTGNMKEENTTTKSNKNI